MLKWIYGSIGFFGTFTLAVLFFLLFICYLAGVAGIADLNMKDKKKNLLLVFSILFLPYPVIWLFKDVVRQRRQLDL